MAEESLEGTGMSSTPHFLRLTPLHFPVQAGGAAAAWVRVRVCVRTGVAPQLLPKAAISISPKEEPATPGGSAATLSSQ